MINFSYSSSDIREVCETELERAIPVKGRDRIFAQVKNDVENSDYIWDAIYEEVAKALRNAIPDMYVIINTEMLKTWHKLYYYTSDNEFWSRDIDMAAVYFEIPPESIVKSLPNAVYIALP